MLSLRMSRNQDPIYSMLYYYATLVPLDLVALVSGKLALEIEHIHKMKRETGPPAK